MKKQLLKNLPKVDELLKDERIEALMDELPREKVVDIIRDAVNSVRVKILEDEISGEETETKDLVMDEVMTEAERVIPRKPETCNKCHGGSASHEPGARPSQ